MIELTKQQSRNLIGKGEIYNQTEVAICIWEHVIEQAAASTFLRSVIYAWFTQEEGAYNGRLNCINLAYLVEIAFLVGNEGKSFRLDGKAFDWEIVPVVIDEFMQQCDSPDKVTIEIAKQVGELLPGIFEK